MDLLHARMVEIELDKNKNVFNTHYKNASIDSIALKNIPTNVMKLFEICSKKSISDDQYIPNNFDLSF